ncbi:FYN-binding protein 1 [Merluccius polli]|uniref:FYN-binding protein 1 n=1 Tax=Merluccius polli TaxID=89951 RepID=A0AA47MRA7_MERPO|nr:FYN-binding protein 1 [Merluccius polli]
MCNDLCVPVSVCVFLRECVARCVCSPVCACIKKGMPHVALCRNAAHFLCSGTAVLSALSLPCHPQAESGDVRSLLTKFNRQADFADASACQNSGPLKPPSPGPRTWVPPGTPPATPENGRLQPKLMPMVTPQPLGAGAYHHREPARMPMAGPRGRPSTPRPQLPPLGKGFPRPPAQPSLSPRTGSPRGLDTGRVRLAEELLQSTMLNRVAGMAPAPAQAPKPTPKQAPVPLQHPAGRGSVAEVAPLRRPLPVESRPPVKPRRPQQVNLEPYLKKNEICLPQEYYYTLICLEQPFPRNQFIKKCQHPNSWDGDSSQNINRESDDSEAYEMIDIEPERTQAPLQPKPHKKQDKKDKKEQQKIEIELRKKFQLKGPLEVLHTAKVQWDWQGGKLDLAVRQGEDVDILRVKDNPTGKWLARTLNGKCGYVSIDCVNVNYEKARHQIQQTKRLKATPLPPPPPDPPETRELSFDVDSSSHVDSDTLTLTSHSSPQLEGPVRVLHTMMVDPNGVILRPKGKELAVAQGEILDVLQFSNEKMALCQNHIGKCTLKPQPLV